MMIKSRYDVKDIIHEMMLAISEITCKIVECEEGLCRCRSNIRDLASRARKNLDATKLLLKAMDDLDIDIQDIATACFLHIPMASKSPRVEDLVRSMEKDLDTIESLPVM